MSLIIIIEWFHHYVLNIKNNTFSYPSMCFMHTFECFVTLKYLFGLVSQAFIYYLQAQEVGKTVTGFMFILINDDVYNSLWHTSTAHTYNSSVYHNNYVY